MRIVVLRGHVQREVIWLGMASSLLLAGCGRSASVAGGSHHRLAGLVLSEVVGGGYVPADVAFAEQLPVVAVYADGRIFTVDAASSVGLGSHAALVRVVERTLPARAVDRIVNLAQAAGVMPHPPAFGRPSTTDLPTTILTVSAEGKTHTIAVYALGVRDGLTSDQVAARRRLQAFSDRLARLGTGTGPGSRPRAYVPQSFSVFAEASDGPPNPPGRPRRWPLKSFRPTAPATFECVPVLSAGAVRRIIPLASRSTSDTVWISAGRRWQVVFRPDLPGTKPCS